MTEDDILLFVRSALPSAWALETLLLLHRDPAVSWSRDALVRELRGSHALVAQSLAMLADAGLVAAVDGDSYAYRPRSRELAERVGALAELYAQKPIAVLRTIFTAPGDKLRSFANAFVFKKPDN